MRIALLVFLGMSFGVVNPAQAENGSHMSSAMSKVLEMVRQRAAAAPSGPALLPSLYGTLERYLNLPGSTLNLRLFRKPITVENLKTDSNLPDELREVEYISKPGSALFDPMPKTVEERLHFLANSIQTHPLSQADEEEYEKSLKCLYSDPSQKTPTSEYRAYIAYRAKREKLIEEIQNAHAQGERYTRLLQLELQNLDDERMMTLPFYNKIEICVDRVAQFDYRKRNSSADEARKALMGSHKPVYDLPSALRQQAGWVMFQGPANANGELMIDGKPISSHVNRFGCNLVNVDLDWRSLFGDSRILYGQWKNSAGYVLSTDDQSHESPNELLPRVNNKMLLADKLEYTFANPGVVSTIRSALQQGRRVTLGGVELTKDRVDFTGPESIKVNSAQVIGVIDERVPKIPTAQ